MSANVNYDFPNKNYEIANSAVIGWSVRRGYNGEEAATFKASQKLEAAWFAIRNRMSLYKLTVDNPVKGYHENPNMIIDKAMRSRIVAH